MMGSEWLREDLWRAHVSWLSPPWVDDTEEKRRDFDAERWMQQLEAAHFRAFIFYVKHHDGWTAYPSAVASVKPERDFLGEAVAAARRHGIKVSLYYSSVFDQVVGHEHPEWLVLGRDGQPVKGWYENYYPGGTYLCINNPGYRAFMLAQITELRDGYDPDALWLDVFEPSTAENCFCPWCREMYEKETGGDLLETAGMEWYAGCFGKLMAEVSALLKSKRADMVVGYNSGQRIEAVDQAVDFLTHEAWDQKHMDLMCRSLRSQGKPYESTYRAYTAVWSWTMRGPERLLIESITTIAHGGACSPELPPTPAGAILDDGVKGLAEVGAYVRAREKYCVGTEPVYDAALLEGDHGYGSGRPVGWADVMAERDIPFGIVFKEADLAPYKLVVLDDRIVCDEALARKLAEYVKGGGAILVEAEAARFGTAAGDVLSEVLGVRCAPRPGLGVLRKGETGEPMQYVSVLGEELPVEGPAWKVRATTAEALAFMRYEYTARSKVAPPWTYLPPAEEVSADPAVTVNSYGVGRAMYVACPLTSVEMRRHWEGGDTREKPMQLADKLARYMIAEPLLEGTTPAGVGVVVNRLGGRHVVHLLNRYVGQGFLDERRGRMRLARVPLSINERRVGEVKRAYSVDEMGEHEMAIARHGEWAEVVVAELGVHEMIVIEH